MDDLIITYVATHFPNGKLRIERERNQRWRAYWKPNGGKAIGGHSATTPSRALESLHRAASNSTADKQVVLPKARHRVPTKNVRTMPTVRVRNA